MASTSGDKSGSAGKGFRFTVQSDPLSILLAQCELCQSVLRSIFPSNRRFTEDFRAKVRDHCRDVHAAGKGAPVFRWRDSGTILEVDF